MYPLQKIYILRWGRNSVETRQRAISIKTNVVSFPWHTQKLKSSVLDTRGVFCILNAFRCLSPGEKHTLILAFCPSAEKKVGVASVSNHPKWSWSYENQRPSRHVPQYCETLELRSQKMNLEVTLCGEGVHQAISCSHSGGILDFGYVLPKDRSSQVFQVSWAAELEEGERFLSLSLDIGPKHVAITML